MKVMMKSVFAGLCVCMASAVLADAPFVKQDDPSSLGLFVWTNEKCPFSEDDVYEMAEKLFKAAKIKPTENLQLNLTLNVDCMPIVNEKETLLGYSMYTEARWGTQLKNGMNVLYEEPDYGFFMIAPESESTEHYLKRIKSSVQEALDDYLSANS